MNSIEKLGQLFKERNNPYSINVTTGKVISANPIKISWGDSVVLEGDNLIIANILKDGFEIDYLDGIEIRKAKVKNPILNGDIVIMIPDNNFKRFYVIDKVG